MKDQLIVVEYDHACEHKLFFGANRHNGHKALLTSPKSIDMVLPENSWFD
jgi:hypothetical protein